MSRQLAYQVLARALRDAIRAGEFADGTPLPTEKDLAAGYGVSRTTVRRAMQDLVAERVIYRVAGRGTFPTSGADAYLKHFGSVEDLMALSEDTECEVVTAIHRRRDADAAARLGLADSAVAALTVRRLHGADPFQITNVWFPPEIGGIIEEVPELSTAGARSTLTVIGVIDARRPGLVMSADQTIAAVTAPPDVARHLLCSPGDPILKVDRLYFDADGNAVESATSFFDPAYYSYRVTLRRRTS